MFDCGPCAPNARRAWNSRRRNQKFYRDSEHWPDDIHHQMSWRTDAHLYWYQRTRALLVMAVLECCVGYLFWLFASVVHATVANSPTTWLLAITVGVMCFFKTPHYMHALRRSGFFRNSPQWHRERTILLEFGLILQTVIVALLALDVATTMPTHQDYFVWLFSDDDYEAGDAKRWLAQTTLIVWTFFSVPLTVLAVMQHYSCTTALMHQNVDTHSQPPRIMTVESTTTTQRRRKSSGSNTPSTSMDGSIDGSLSRSAQLLPPPPVPPPPPPPPPPTQNQQTTSGYSPSKSPRKHDADKQKKMTPGVTILGPAPPLQRGNNNGTTTTTTTNTMKSPRTGGRFGRSAVTAAFNSLSTVSPTSSTLGHHVNLNVDDDEMSFSVVEERPSAPPPPPPPKKVE
jgi:hypothetical protein